jgi:Co/Zn/Cd efflux system component
MIESSGGGLSAVHSHVFLGEGHEKNERKTWAVIALCGAMMIAEIVGGLLFGSIALVADGLHMSTHAGALLLAALAYTYARKHANDQNFTFGTGKLGDLAGFSSAIILAMIALLIAYESVSRLFAPVTIHFAEAIPIACLGLAVNVASAWLLSGGGHHHGHSHGHAHEGHDHDEGHQITIDTGVIILEVFEDGVPPRFRLRVETGPALTAQAALVETVRPYGTRQLFAMKDQAAIWNRPKRFLNRTRSLRMSGSANRIIPSSLKSTNMCTDRRPATTTCGLPRSTSWPMPQSR